MDSIGSRMKMLRKKKHFTQEDMAEALGKSRSNYGGYETDRILPPSDILDKIATMLDTSADYLLGKTDSSMPASADDRFVDSLDLSDDDIMRKFNVTLDGQALSAEQLKMAIAFLRTVKQQNQ